MKIFLTGGSGFIGTNLVSELLHRGDAVLSFDNSAPRCEKQSGVWRKGDLLDAGALRQAMADFTPDVAFHLAARADCDENTTVEEGYRANTDGTANFLSAVAATPSVKRAIIVSSQYVAGPSRLPVGDEDYFPHTVYGQSKVITEQLTREANLPCCWTLVRPTNVWGPWHWRYPQEFWKIAAKGIYVHPGGAPVRRCYAYVGNVVWQMLRLLELPEDTVSGKTFYVGDEVADIYDWASGFCVNLCGRRAPKIPRPILRAIALVGDAITAVRGKQFYLTSSRYRSMTSDYPTPMEKTFEVLGKGPFSLQQGIAETVIWLRSYGGTAFKKK
ncbi:MAG: NAD-dependent epimerase/dehydratase family protein [Terrimicrobiaceae bacterium]